ncbi:DAP [Cordylochernes scorpioides]|uniref:DAP n=1 Tax=Cordylochernes scorpioides TaxID=51811 RepID=A0ABY6KGD4_9ARAC|nr:DAP [Cordylochernes scorpioides]
MFLGRGVLLPKNCQLVKIITLVMKPVLCREVFSISSGLSCGVKAGGMRITQNKHPMAVPEKPDGKKQQEEDEEYPPPPSPPKAQLVISGVPARGDADFPAEAVKAFHTKPVPSHDFRASASKPVIIHQPKK